ncbi:hypothetical protein ACIQUY_04930 [Streptomyces sp. NPDC090231]|uniref:hypothetical protein n=1 Tax=unclassified Streptomyces TaxID=2593676 RepID=UPI00381E2D3F
MSNRQFRDCDGDTWSEDTAGYLTCVSLADGTLRESGRTETRSWVEGNYGPLIEIRPNVDVRALLAGVLEEMAEEADDLRYSEDDAAGSAGVAMARIFRRKALELRELESA